MSCCCNWITAPLWNIYYVLRYLEKEIMHQIFVIGLCRNWRQAGVRSEQNLAEIENLGPIQLCLDNQRFACEDGSWSAGPGIPRTAMGIQREIEVLKHERKILKKELAKHAKKAEDLKGMKDKINMLDFKYQLLLDMWTTKVMGGDKEGVGSPRQGRSRTPSPRKSPRTSPKRSRSR